MVAIVVLAAVVLINQPSNSSALVTPPELAPANLTSGYSLGKADAPVTIDLWEDFQCPACGLFSREIEPRVMTQFVETGTVRLVFNDFAFIGAEPRGGAAATAFGQDQSVDAAIAARCAGAQGPGKFWNYMQYLYWNQGPENGGKFVQPFFDQIATALGLDLATFNSCLTEPSQLQAVVAQTQQGSKLGVDSTPTLFINGTKQAGVSTYDALAAEIQAAAKGQPLSGASPGASLPETTVPPSPGASSAAGSAAPATGSAPAASGAPAGSPGASAAP